MSLSEVQPGGGPYSLLVKVVDSVEVDRVRRDGRSQGKQAEVLIGDSTASIIFIARDEQVDIAKPGAFLSISDASTEVFRGSMRLVVGKHGKVEAATGNFKPATANNLSLIEFELVTAEIQPSS